MSIRAAVRLSGVALAVALSITAAGGYIHFPPITLQKLCQTSHHVRVLKVAKFDKDKRVIVFEVAETLKGEKALITSFKHVIRADAEGTKPILDWVEKGKTAVAFSIEGQNGSGTLGIAYVFIDDFCYTVDYNAVGDCWILLRAEPGMSACYHGSAEELRKLAKDVLDGKDVKVPTKAPEKKQDDEKRRTEINEAFKKTRP